MNSHQLIDERCYEMNQVIARLLRDDPSKLSIVLEQIDRRLADPDYSESLKRCVSEWREIIVRGVEAVLTVLADRSDEGTRLRHNSPFAILMPQDERMEILQRYQEIEKGRSRTYPAGV
ncbi:MAG: hypothetical protein KDM63_01880 [Verrucomicrobiae bacterium]|nr:hypothetical protein [Verrucomicrobiae bacterium]MCB1085768.1 hypothetical protein [Verrucomicrobiae bacterium]MCB1090953.1 hypothetical protein [Verrucomicrobiae bacterium]